ncbi:MAG: hypothetical protein HY815_03820 [Candidatus Riflebacteria bacterium]|nr:hypothetical protein [Candidatus Riflebacteria bacterium]
MIDAQRSLAQVSLDYVSALVEYHRALARLEGLVARELLTGERGAAGPSGAPTKEADPR